MPSNTSNVSSQGDGTGGSSRSRGSSLPGAIGLAATERSSISLTRSSECSC